MASQNSFNTHSSLTVGGRRFQYYSLPALEKAGHGGVARLPYSLKILLENLLRREDGRFVDRDDIQTLAGMNAISRAFYCRTSPASPPSSISPRCATVSSSSAAIRSA